MVRNSDPAIDPGGRLTPPSRLPALLLDLQIRPRVQPYLETDVTGTLIVDAPVRQTSRILKIRH